MNENRNNGCDEDEEFDIPPKFRNLKISQVDIFKKNRIKELNKELSLESLESSEDKNSPEAYSEYAKQNFSGEGLSWFVLDIALILRHCVN